MFDLSWGEVLMIGAIALIVIGPKDLPGALRTLGRIIGKARRMAGDFQSQFNEALREADLDQVRRDVEGLNKAASNITNPARAIRDEVKGAIEGADKKPASTKPPSSKPDAFKPGSVMPAAPKAGAENGAAAAPAEAPEPAAAIAPEPQPDPVRTEEKNT